MKSCDLHAKEYQSLATNYEIEKESVTSLITSQLLGDARLQLWIQILPSLGIAHLKIQHTVPFANPAELVFALEQAIFRDRDGEKLQLQMQFWQATLASEGSGDPVRFHRYVTLAGRKLALLNNEPIRDQDMRAVFIKGLPDEIFMDFKTALHNNPAGTKTLNDVYEILNIYAGSEAVKQKVASLMRQCARSFDKRPPAGVFVTQDSASPRPCFDFAKGKCTRGSQCKFAHSNVPRTDASPPPWCVLTATSVGIRLPRATLSTLKSVWLVCARDLLLSLRSPFLVLVQHFCLEFEMTSTSCCWRMSMRRKWGQCFPLLPRPLSFPMHCLQWL